MICDVMMKMISDVILNTVRWSESFCNVVYVIFLKRIHSSVRRPPETPTRSHDPKRPVSGLMTSYWYHQPCMRWSLTRINDQVGIDNHSGRCMKQRSLQVACWKVVPELAVIGSFWGLTLFESPIVTAHLNVQVCLESQRHNTSQHVTTSHNTSHIRPLLERRLYGVLRITLYIGIVLCM